MPALPQKVSSFSSTNIHLSVKSKKYRWNSNDYSSIHRRLDIWLFFLSLMFKLWLNSKKFSYRGERTQAKLIKRRRALAVWIREKLLDLGPTFIKVGQALSTRPDLIHPDFLDELVKLQDQLPSFDNKVAFSIIEHSLKIKIDKAYKEISPNPVAAASLGQVYRAILYTGEEVAVKVQRANLESILTCDLFLMRWIASKLSKFLPLNLEHDLTLIVDEFGSKLLEEIDYINEGKNAEKFASNFRNDADVKVPKIYWAFSSDRILTLEWIQGYKLTNTEQIKNAGLDPYSLSLIHI